MANKLILKVYTQERAYEFFLDSSLEETYLIGPDIEDDIWIPELEGYQYQMDCKPGFVKVQSVIESQADISEIYTPTPNNPTLQLADKTVYFVFFFENQFEYGFYALTYRDKDARKTKRIAKITVGNRKDSVGFRESIIIRKALTGKAHIGISCQAIPLVSNKHAVLFLDDFGSYWVEDHDSTNGVYVNGFKIKPNEKGKKRVKLTYGDTIDLFTAKIVFKEEILLIEKILGKYLVVGMDEAAIPVFSKEDNMPVLSRAPRRQKSLPGDPIKIPAPPSESKNSRDIGRVLIYMLRPLMWLALPIVAGIIQGSGVEFNWATGAMYLIGPAMMIYQFIRQSRRTKKENEKRFARYLEKLEKREKELDETEREQRIRFERKHNAQADNLNRAVSYDWRTWERDQVDDDFLEIRVGTGMGEHSFQIDKPEEEALEDKPEQLVDALEEMLGRHQHLSNYPLTIDLKERPNIGVYGFYQARTQLVTAMLLQIAMHHKPSEAKIVLIIPEYQISDFKALLSLPHLWDEGYSRRLVFLKDNRDRQCDGHCYDDESDNKTYCPFCLKDKFYDRFVETFKLREKQFEDKDLKQRGFAPHYVFVISDTSLISGENAHELSNYLLNDHANIGVHTVCLGEQSIDLPDTFENLISAGFQKGSFFIKEGDEHGFHADIYDAATTEKISRALAPIQIENLMVSKNIPTSVSLLDLHGAGSLEDLDIADKWAKDLKQPNPATPVGRLDQTRNLDLDIRLSGIGPHGVVGGTTGSGKSEFLLSAILGFAIRCHPQRLNMVILDYKGGSTAQACETLPHVRGIVTDLDKGPDTKRALAAIKTELTYREDLFKLYTDQLAVRVDNLESYHEYVSDGPELAYMLVVVDELAELKIREPNAMEIIEDIARRGRSVGVHLLLTTQNPQGVINSQIQSNINYKVCFRISKDNSRGIIDSPEAAYISDRTPGRALIRVGNDELSGFQSGYTGAAYVDKKDRSKHVIPTIYEVTDEGERVPIFIDESEQKSRSKSSQLTKTVQYISDYTAAHKVSAMSALWKPVLPNILVLKYINTALDIDQLDWTRDRVEFKLCFGLSDDIDNRRYLPTEIDFNAANPNFSIFGGQGTGKTTLLLTILLSLAYLNSPKLVNFFLFDLSASPNTAIEKLPHTGNVFTLRDETEIVSGLKLISGGIKNRSNLFANCEANNLEEYNKNNSENRLPYIFVFIDNIDAFDAMKAQHIENLREILRSGKSLGFIFVVTAKRKLPFGMKEFFSGQECLLKPDAGNYDLPRGFLMTKQAPGRGIYNGLEFQAALLDDPELFASVNEIFASWIDRMKQKASNFSVLKSFISAKELTAEEIDSIADQASVVNIPIGIMVDSQAVKYMEMDTKQQLMLSYMEISTARKHLAYIMDRMLNVVSDTDAFKATCFTGDIAWLKKYADHPLVGIEQLKFEKGEGKGLTDKSRQKIDAYIDRITDTNNGAEEKQIFVCDSISDFLSGSSHESYDKLNAFYQDGLISQNSFMLYAAKPEEIAAWKKAGCNLIRNAIREQASLLLDGKLNEHIWCIKAVNRTDAINKDYVYGFDKKGLNMIRLPRS